MDTSRLLKPAGVAVLSVFVGILASIGNEVVLVSLLVVLTGILVIWKQNQVLYYLLQERNHVVPLHQVPVSKNSKSTKNKHLNEKNVYLESREAQKQETLSNRKNKQSKGKNAYLDNSEVQKKENFSKMESKQPQESSEKLMLEVRMSGMKYTSGYLEMCKYFEEVEDDAVRDKKVRLACELRHQGFDLDKVIDAARNCDNFDTATRYLMQKCDSCAKFFSLPEIVQMFMCTHKLCKGCIKNHVAKAMKGRNILDCTCKVCEMPKLEFEDKALEYLSNLDCNLKSILPSEVHQQFHRELMSGTWKTRLKSKESKGSTGTTADNDNDWPKLGSRFNKNSTDLPILGSDSSCSFCGTKTYSPYKMISCEHKLCRSCTTAFFSQLILTADITDCVCPVCRKPEFHSQEDFFNYFIDFRKNFCYIFDAGTRESLERKFQDYIDNMNGDYGTRTEVVTEASSKTESNVQAQPEVTYPQVPSTSKENNVGAASAPEKACSDCKELPDNSNIFVGKMKEADARCEDGPEPATFVSSYSIETFNMDQPCDMCFQRAPKEKVTKIFGCHHNFCVDCIWINFILFTIYKMSKNLSCPVCHRPYLFESKTRALTYLFDLSISLKKILDQYQYREFKKSLHEFVNVQFIEQGSDGTNNNL